MCTIIQRKIKFFSQVIWADRMRHCLVHQLLLVIKLRVHRRSYKHCGVPIMDVVKVFGRPYVETWTLQETFRQSVQRSQIWNQDHPWGLNIVLLKVMQIFRPPEAPLLLEFSLIFAVFSKNFLIQICILLSELSFTTTFAEFSKRRGHWVSQESIVHPSSSCCDHAYSYKCEYKRIG